jgi:hypothetical protein
VICEIKRYCSYLPSGALRRTSSEKFSRHVSWFCAICSSNREQHKWKPRIEPSGQGVRPSQKAFGFDIGKEKRRSDTKAQKRAKDILTVVLPVGTGSPFSKLPAIVLRRGQACTDRPSTTCANPEFTQPRLRGAHIYLRRLFLANQAGNTSDEQCC